MSVYKSKKSPFYSYEFVIDGRRFRGPTKRTNERDAILVERQKREAAMQVMQRMREAGWDGSQIPKLKPVLDRYWNECCDGTGEAITALAYINELVDIIGGDRLLTDITDSDIAKLVSEKKKRARWGKQKNGPVSNATVNRLVQFLRRAMRRANKYWRVPLPMMPNWEIHILEEPKERIRIMSPSEHAEIAKLIDPDYAVLFNFCLLTGLRKKSALLKWAQVNFEQGYFEYVGKGGKFRRKPMTDAIRQLLASRVGHHSEWVFTFIGKRSRVYGLKNRRKGLRSPITVTGLGSHWRRVKEKAGIKDLRWHDIRHTFATLTLAATKNLALVQDALDHSDPSITRKYAHVMMDSMRDGLATAGDAISAFYSGPVISGVVEHKQIEMTKTYVEGKKASA